MKYKIDKILRDVRIAMRENPVAPTALADTAQLTIDQWITSRLPHAVAAAHEQACPAAFDSPLSFGSSITWTRPDMASGQILLPADFLRLVAFRMSDWDCAVATAIQHASAAYMRQQSPHPGVRGNPRRPVCAIVPSARGPVLEFYSCASTSATITQALYVPQPSIDANDTIDIAPACYRPVIDILTAEYRK